MRKFGKPEARARGWVAAAYVDQRALNRRQADESGTLVPIPNPSLALQAPRDPQTLIGTEVSFSNGASDFGVRIKGKPK